MSAEQVKAIRKANKFMQVIEQVTAHYNNELHMDYSDNPEENPFYQLAKITSEKYGPGHEQKRCRQPAPDQLTDLCLLFVGPAQIALHQAADIFYILNGQRFIEPEFLADRFHRGLGGASARDHSHGVGGHEK